MIITLIRHGETDDNRNEIIQGHKDTPLNELGIQQARLTGQFLSQSNIRFDQIWSSDLQRARKTAEIIAEHIDGSPPLQTDKRLRERFLGELEGKPRTKNGPRLDPKSAESHESVLARLVDFWKQQVIPASEKTDHILIVSHGGALRSLIFSGLIQNFGYQVPDHLNLKGINFANCSITTVHIISHHSNVINAIANVDHLAGKILASNANADDINPNS